MDNRTNKFLSKFTDAVKYLDSDSVQHIVSLKYRENVGHSDYVRLVEGLRRNEISLGVEEIHGNFQGNAWLVKDRDRNAVILVEHETGLEIISRAADIISLLAVIPMIASGWKYLRKRFPRFGNDKVTQIEIRTINSKGQLIEERVLSVDDDSFEESLKEIEINTLKAKIKQLEKEIEISKKRQKVQAKKVKKPTKRKIK